MCFSMSMSFLAAGLLISIGILTLRKASSPYELPLACIPFIFAVQQAAEGVLWLLLPTGHHLGFITIATYVFLIAALVIWPVYIPLSLLLIEPSYRARGLIALCFLIGIGWSLGLLSQGIAHGASASIHQCHLVYTLFTGETNPLLYLGLYCFTTLTPFFVSSTVSLRSMGTLLALFCAITYFVWSSFFVSVWCFFAALLSIKLYTALPIKVR